MVSNSIEGILFLSYFTDYNIGEIYKAFAYPGIDDYINSEGERLNKQLDGKISLNQKINESLNEARIALEKNRYNKIYHLPIASDKYPAILKTINQPPPMLYVKGRFVSGKNSAIIGTRKTSRFAEERTYNIVNKFLDYGYGIVSGLAHGIDTFAHKAALEKKAYTIAVMPHSLDSVYPKENYWLANRILDADGSLISEIPTGLNRGKKSFVERNRIQSGISEFVVPVEMSIKSGTMHTVNFCKTQKRKLLLIQPFKELDNEPQYEGINHLIEIQKKSKNDHVFIVNDDFDLSLIPNEKDTILRDLELFDYMNVDIEKFREFLTSQGYFKIIEGNIEKWKHLDGRELSFISNTRFFTYDQTSDTKLLYSLGLQKAFRNYFNVQ